MQVILVGLGGFFGAIARYGIGRLLVGGSFPYATLLVNVVGSLLIGLAVIALAARSGDSSHIRLFLVVGFLGAFTTFSAFSLETLALIQQESWGRALVNVFANLLLCLVAVATGMFLGRSLVH